MSTEGEPKKESLGKSFKETLMVKNDHLGTLLLASEIISGEEAERSITVDVGEREKYTEEYTKVTVKSLRNGESQPLPSTDLFWQLENCLYLYHQVEADCSKRNSFPKSPLSREIGRIILSRLRQDWGQPDFLNRLIAGSASWEQFKENEGFVVSEQSLPAAA